MLSALSPLRRPSKLHTRDSALPAHRRMRIPVSNADVLHPEPPRNNPLSTLLKSENDMITLGELRRTAAVLREREAPLQHVF